LKDGCWGEGKVFVGWFLEEIMKNKICPWRQVLNEILDYAPEVYDDEGKLMGIRAVLPNSHPLAEKLNISVDELSDSLDFMEKMELIEIPDSCIPPLHPIGLTLKGFEVAEDYKKMKLNASLTFSLIYITSMIWFTAFFGFINQLQLISTINIFYSYMVVGVGFGIWCYFFIYRKLK